VRGIDLCNTVQIAPPYLALGPFSIEDTQGYGVAVQMVLASWKKGQHADYLQWATIRQYRTAYANVFKVSAPGIWQASVWVDEKGGSKRVSTISTHSEWFELFAQGCEKRMGAIYKPDLALTSAIMQVYLEVIQERVDQAITLPEKHLWISVGAYSALCFCASL
jgi:hypothetical protein